MLLPLVFTCVQKVCGQAHFFDARVSKYGELEQVLGDKWDKTDSLIVHGPIKIRHLAHHQPAICASREP